LPQKEKLSLMVLDGSSGRFNCFWIIVVSFWYVLLSVFLRLMFSVLFAMASSVCLPKEADAFSVSPCQADQRVDEDGDDAAWDAAELEKVRPVESIVDSAVGVCVVGAHRVAPRFLSLFATVTVQVAVVATARNGFRNARFFLPPALTPSPSLGASVVPPGEGGELLCLVFPSFACRERGGSRSFSACGRGECMSF
jgi:hypothetical protein